MRIEDAQREVRSTFIGSFAGSLVSGAIWLLSAAFVTWGSRRIGILMLAGGGAFIFPLHSSCSARWGRGDADPANPMNGLAMRSRYDPHGDTAHRRHHAVSRGMVLSGVQSIIVARTTCRS